MSGANAIAAALGQLAGGGMIVLCDDVGREDEGDLCMAAEHISAAAVNFMARHGRGLICLAMSPERAEALQLPPMVEHNTSAFGTAFTVSIEARVGVTTGISAADRARTIATAAAEGCRPEDLARPGHVFGLRARSGGVLARRGQTEGSVDAVRMAGLRPMAVICEIMADDGRMLRGPPLADYAQRFGLPMLSVAALVTARWQEAPALRCLGEQPHPEGHWHTYQTSFDGRRHQLLARQRRARLDRAVLCVGGPQRAAELSLGGADLLVTLSPGPEAAADAFIAAQLLRAVQVEAVGRWEVPAGWAGAVGAQAAAAGLQVAQVVETPAAGA